MNDDILNTLEPNSENDGINPIEELEENPQHLSDVLVTQIILCIAIVTGIFILNIFNPETSSYMMERFKYYSNQEFSETVKNILSWLYDRI